MAGNQQAGGRRGHRRSQSRFATQLQEKQQLKGIFGIREEQLKRYFEAAHRHRAETGPVMLVLLEQRLDSAVYRAGFAQTRKQARQMVSHRFFSVNDRPVNIPSYQIKLGDVVTIRDSKRTASYFENFEKRMQGARPPSWIGIDSDSYQFTLTALPEYEEINLGIDIRAIVEFFAR